MKQTHAEKAGIVFVDTNVLVYLYSTDEPAKKQTAQSIFTEERCVISTQVLQEFANTAFRKLKSDWSSISKALAEICDAVPVWINTEETIE